MDEKHLHELISIQNLLERLPAHRFDYTYIRHLLWGNVPDNIFVKSTKENHCDHSSEKNDDDGRINETEPMNSRIQDV